MFNYNSFLLLLDIFFILHLKAINAKKDVGRVHMMKVHNLQYVMIAILIIELKYRLI